MNQCGLPLLFHAVHPCTHMIASPPSQNPSSSLCSNLFHNFSHALFYCLLFSPSLPVPVIPLSCALSPQRRRLQWLSPGRTTRLASFPLFSLFLCSVSLLCCCCVSPGVMPLPLTICLTFFFFFFLFTAFLFLCQCG